MLKLAKIHITILFLSISFGINAQTKTVNANDILVNTSDTLIIPKEIANQKGTYVIDVEKNYLANLGSAKEVLLNIPFIQISGEDKISVMGKTGAKIMIDKRLLFNLSELSQIRSQSIHSIRVETISKSSYPYPTIIIITKTKKDDELSGGISSELLFNPVTESLYNNNVIDLSYKQGSIELFSSLAHKIYHYNIEEERRQNIDAINYVSEQNLDEISKEKDWRSNLGMIKTIDDNHIFGLMYRGEHSPSPTIKAKGKSIYHLNGEQHTISDLDYKTKIKHGTNEFNAFYNGKIKEQNHIKFNTDYASGYLNNNSLTKEQFNIPVTNYAGLDVLSEEQLCIDKNDFDLFSANISIEHNLSPFSLTYGAEFYTTIFNCNSIDEVNNLSDEIFKENKNNIKQREFAGFATLQKQWEKLTIETGIRYENNKIKHTTNSVIQRDSLIEKFLPRLSVSYNLTDDLAMEFSYSEEMEYFQFHSLQKNYIYHGFDLFYRGNPHLKPTQTKSLNYNLSWKSLQFFTTYSFIENAIFDVGYRLNNHRVVVMQPENMPKMEELSIGVSSNFKFGRLETNIALSMEKTNLQYNGQSYKDPVLNYMLNNKISLPKDWNFMLLFSGTTKGHEGVSYLNKQYKLDLMIQKDLLKNKNLSFTLRYNDIFRTFDKEAEVHTNGVSFIEDEHNLNGGIMIQLSYRFNSFKKKLSTGLSSGKQLERLLIEHE